ncbi:MAG: lipopolysaccharide biosynthesis protein [Gammaproteobacteria bacterium]
MVDSFPRGAGLEPLARTRLGRGVGGELAWNTVSFVVMALSTAAAFFIVGRWHGEAALGVFSQAYAIYVVASQVVVLGVQFSVLRAAAAMPATDAAMRPMLWGALGVVLGAGLVTVALGSLSLGAAERLFDSAEVRFALAASLPGLLFFGANKVLISWLNGTRRMRAVALAQGARGALIVLWMLVLSLAEMPSAALSAALAAAEACLFVALALDLWRRAPPCGGASAWRWARAHARFGGKALGGGVIMEANSRVDVFLLGVFLSDREVGIYSLASMGFEAMLQVCQVLRVSLNPRLARLHARGRTAMLQKYARHALRASYALLAGLALAAALLYPLVVNLVFGAAFMASVSCFALLMAGFALTSGYRAVDMLLVQAGMPGWHTLVLGGGMLANVALNAALIPMFGLEGGALATALSLPVGVLLLKLAARRLVGISI